MAEGMSHRIEEFFSRKMAFGRIYAPIIIVSLAGAAHALVAVAVYYSIEVDRAGAFDANLLYGLALAATPWALWLLFVLGIYFIAILLGGNPLTGHLFRGVGWAMIPLIPAYLIWALARYVTLQDVVYEDNPIRGIDHDWDYFVTYIAEIHGDPIYVGAMVGAGIFVLLTGWLFSIMTRRAAKLDRTRAAVAGFVPALAYAAFLILNAYIAIP